MPELPEVETIRLGLEKKIIGLTLKKLEVLNPKTFEGDAKVLSGQKVIKVWRRAKVLGIDFTHQQSLIFHLKMTGQVIYDDGKRRLSGGHPTQDMRDAMPNKSTRVVFSFSDGSKLFFNDQRKFGWVKIMETATLSQHKFLASLGPEPLEKTFTSEVLKERLLKHKNWPVKVAILDQQTVAGIGNIYASEACFNAKIHPTRQVSSLSDQEFASLRQGIIKCLLDGIKYGGSTRAHFVNADGDKGYFLDYAFVYQQDKQPCKVCGEVIQKIQLGGRGTYFCHKCQI